MRKVPPFLLLDAWRGIAALWVVMTHACVSFLATGDNIRFLHSPLYAFSIWGQLGVVIFFVISGYCIMGAAYSTLASGRTVGRYALDRVRRIYPPYLVACLACLAIGLLIAYAQQHHLLVVHGNPLDRQAFQQPLFWGANLLLVQLQMQQPTILIVAWSLCYEIAFYALLGVMLFAAGICARRFSVNAGVLIFQVGIGALTLVSLLLLIAFPETCHFPFDRWYQFGVGALLFLLFAADARSAWSVRAQLVVAGVLVLIYGLRVEFWPDALREPTRFVVGQVAVPAQAGTCVLFVTLLWLLRPFDQRVVRLPVLRPLIWIGTFSYSLYLVHPLLIGFVDAGFRRIGFDQNWYWVTYWAEVAFGVLEGWIFYLLVERHFISQRQKKRVELELAPAESVDALSDGTPEPLSSPGQVRPSEEFTG